MEESPSRADFTIRKGLLKRINTIGPRTNGPRFAKVADAKRRDKPREITLKGRCAKNQNPHPVAESGDKGGEPSRSELDLATGLQSTASCRPWRGAGPSPYLWDRGR